MNCKKCDTPEIDEQAYNAPGGGFLCKTCYRRLQIKSVAIGLSIAAVGVLAILLLFAIIIARNWPPGN